MKISDVMTRSPKCCTPDTSLTDVARLMVDLDCGGIPVVTDPISKIAVGMITDRDVVVRAVAAGLDPAVMVVRDCMTTPPITIQLDLDLRAAIELCEEHKIRRLLVVDTLGAVIGIIAPADIAAHASKRKAGELLREVSQPWGSHA